MSTRWNWRALLRVLIPVATLPLFMLAAHPVFSMSQRLLAWGVFVVATFPALRLLARPVSVPLIELVGIQYAVFYSIPIFYDDRLKVSQNFMTVSDAAISTTLVATLLAVIYILLGYELARRSSRVNFSWIRFPASSTRVFAYGIALIALPVMLQLARVGGSMLTGPLEILLPRNLGLALLASAYYSGSLDGRRRIVVYVMFALATLLGLLGGMMQLAAEPFIIWTLARFVYRRKAPTGAIVGVVIAFFVLQPVKTQYRVLMGSGIRDFTAAEALGVYGTLVKTLWTGIASDRAMMVDLAKQSASERISWLQTTAWYVQLTPDMIPYRGAKTLLYPFYSLVPRVVWPGKPLAQEANKTLPVEYGFQSPENLDKTMFGVGHVAEAFTAFGLAGIMPIFLLIGIVYAVPELLLRNSPSLVTVAMMIWLATSMMHIGSTVGNALGGLLQQILIQTLLLRVFTEDRRRKTATLGPTLGVATN